MALPFEQALALSFPKVLKERDGAYTQYGATPVMRLMKAQGGIEMVDGGHALQPILDFQENPAAAFLDAKGDSTSTAQTEVVTKAQYEWARLVVPYTYNLFDEQDNAGKDDTQIVKMALALSRNALKSFDRKIERYMLGTTANNMIGIRSLIAEDGTGTFGQVNAGVETWWKNQFDEYTDGNDIEASVHTVYKACARGNPDFEPSILVSGSDTHSTYEAALEERKRFVDGDKAVSGFNVIAVYNGRYVYSEFGTDSIFMWNSQQTKLYGLRSGYRKLRPGIEHVNSGKVTVRILSSVQFLTGNRSTTGVSFT
jgi:hypothetical protein